MVKVLIKKLNPAVRLPEYKSSGASGMDLTAFIEKPIIVKSKTSSLIPTGLSVALHEKYEIQIRPRSGLAAKSNITVLNKLGTMHNVYWGEIKVIIYNDGNDDFVINNGDRIAQMVLSPIIRMELEEVKDLPKTIRGEGGFGSTGKWVQN